MPITEHCPGCPYREFGPAIGTRGDPSRRIVLVGEAPGTTEIGEGRPFVGRAGTVLWEALSEVGLGETDVFVTNAVACQPKPVHPRVAAIDACRERLAGDLASHPRAVIVALGGTAVRAVTQQRGFRVLTEHGRGLTSAWGPVTPTLHPARVLRRPSERPLLVADLMVARRLARGD